MFVLFLFNFDVVTQSCMGLNWYPTCSFVLFLIFLSFIYVGFLLPCLTLVLVSA